MDGRMDGRTDGPSLRDGKTHLKPFYGLICWKNLIFSIFWGVMDEQTDGWIDRKIDGRKGGEADPNTTYRLHYSPPIPLDHC